jgi:hypothetical protein
MAFVAGTDGIRGGPLDSEFDSADQPGREKQTQAATARAAEQRNLPSILRELLMCHNLRPIQPGRKGKTF